MLNFKPAFSLSSFTLKRLFSSTVRVVSSAYLRLLIFLPTILIPAYASSILTFCMMYSACNLNKQVRKSVLRQVDKKSGEPEEEKGVWGFEEEIGYGILKEEERTNFLFFFFSYIP